MKIMNSVLLRFKGTAQWAVIQQISHNNCALYLKIRHF